MTPSWEDFALNDGFEKKIYDLQTAEYAIYRECLQARRAADPQVEEEVARRLVENTLELREK